MLPKVRPIIVILIAAEIFPFEKPVHDIVIPEVGRSAVNKSPSITKLLPLKKIFPISKPIKGIIRKFIAWAVSCSLGLPLLISSFTLRLTIMG